VAACGDYQHGRKPQKGDGIVTFEAQRA
jgi:hypothetical protein